MYLDEFELDLPYLDHVDHIKNIMNERNCDYSDAKKIDYVQTWKDKRRIFNLHTRCMTAMYERLFSKYKNSKCQKIIVECVDTLSEEKNIINYLGTYTVQVKFEYNRFVRKSNYEKKVKALKLLISGIEKIVKFNDWNIGPFLDTRDQIINYNYENEWLFKKPLVSPNKKYIAEVICIHEVDNFIIKLVVKDLKNNLIKYDSIYEKPHEFAYAKHLGKLEWKSETDVCLINRDGTIVSVVSIKE
ncbi:hypothetical protein [Haloplasma contractile]|uniref:Uncharacterized protein n=1 Tax=Haloplasma contractile SSD-17B TaxID=1033810 RepID=U2DR73_9MOLU|nr:hypothetical protein [Haloplasma contractile]ERJ11072.1 hypothetical protein HLPCO_002893 [Haloplasma contractile SSD-17B]